MVKIPVEAIPNQQVSVNLDGQNCTIHLYQRGRYLFMDLTVDGVAVRLGSICLVNQLSTGYSPVGFKGALAFSDILQQGGIPVWNELGSRYILFYFSEDEI